MPHKLPAHRDNNICMRASEGNFGISAFKTCYFLHYFCWYFRCLDGVIWHSTVKYQGGMIVQATPPHLKYWGGGDISPSPPPPPGSTPMHDYYYYYRAYLYSTTFYQLGPRESFPRLPCRFSTFHERVSRNWQRICEGGGGGGDSVNFCLNSQFLSPLSMIMVPFVPQKPLTSN